VLKNTHTHLNENSTRGLTVASPAVWAAIATKNNTALRCTDSISTRLLSNGCAICFIVFMLVNAHTYFMKNSTRRLALASPEECAASAIKDNKSLWCTDSVIPRILSYMAALSNLLPLY
jgi:hypothetical protein